MSAPGDGLLSVIRRARRLFDECGPEPGQYERFFERLHGPGWKERALANAPPQPHLVYDDRLRELEVRVARIERHLRLTASKD
jgi:hypothetical protein